MQYRVVYLSILSISYYQIATFQLVLISDGDATFCIFNYGTIEFTSGSEDSGFGGTPAQVWFKTHYK